MAAGGMNGTASREASTPTAANQSFDSRAISPSPSISDRRPRTSSGTVGDEVGLLKHQVRLLKAENYNLKEKLGTKTNPAPFGQSLPRRPSGTGPSLSPPSHSQRSSSGRPGSPDRATSPLPGAVSLTRALFPDPSAPPVPPLPSPSDSGSPAFTTSPTLATSVDMDASYSSSPNPQQQAPPSPSTKSHNGSTHSGENERKFGGGAVRNSQENPFFGSGASRERMKNSAASAASGSGKVISGLQSELIQVKGALESARSQLRLSQKAVEFLTRQNEDLKESKERLTTTVGQLDSMLARKTRLHDDLTSRVHTAESSLSTLQTTHQTLLDTHTSRIEEVEKEKEDATARMTKAESEYEALRGGMRSMSEGWRKDLEWVKEDFEKVGKRRDRETEELKSKLASLTKLHQEREESQSSISTTLSSLHSLENSFQQHFSKLFTDLTVSLPLSPSLPSSATLSPTLSSSSSSTKASRTTDRNSDPAKEGEELEALKIARGLEEELKRLRRLIESHRGGTGESPG